MPIEFRFLAAFLLSPLFAASILRSNSASSLTLAHKIAFERPHFVDGQLGQEIAALTGSHFELLKPYGIGIKGGAFIHLDLKSYSVINPLQYAGSEELRNIIENLKDFNSSSAASLVSRLKLSQTSQKSAQQYLKSHPEILRQLLSVGLDKRVIGRIRSSLSLGDASWSWLFDGGSLPPSVGGPLTPGQTKPAPAIFPFLQTELKSPNEFERINGVRILGLSGFASLPKLNEIAKTDSSRWVRASAVHWLGALGGPEAVDDLWDLFQKEKDDYVRGKILTALNRSRDSRSLNAALGMVSKAIDSKTERGESLGVALNILRADFIRLNKAQEQDHNLGLSLFLERMGLKSSVSFSLDPQAARMMTEVAVFAKVLSDENSLSQAHSLKYQAQSVLGYMVEQSHLLFESSLEDQKHLFDSLTNSDALYSILAISPIHAHDVGTAVLANIQKKIKGKKEGFLDWLNAEDPDKAETRNFFLRLSEMDLLSPLLQKNPSLAMNLASYVFPSGSDDAHGGWDAVRMGAFCDGALSFWPQKDRLAFIQGLVRQKKRSTGIDSTRLDALLSAIDDYYGNRLTQEEKNLINSSVSLPGNFARSPAINPDLILGKNRRQMNGFIAFDQYRQFRDFLKEALARGYRVIETGPRIVLKRGFIRMELIGPPRGQEGFRWVHRTSEEWKQWEKSVHLKSRVSGSQWMAMRGEPWFTATTPDLLKNYAGKKPKLVFLGSCRSVDQITEIKKACPRCVVLANEGTGYYRVDNEVLFSALNWLSKGASWREIGKNLEDKMPKRFSEIVGPWHFGYLYQSELGRLGLN